ncbi:hypothetical protein PSACC_02345 [Paramicrosporidium saccamoebae]|uniref:separase n=1 Tax=Paramicrosporidium saccamoebae TaxID=1246581 RepID=A0A2H9TJ98_9FUNG|nr:hypothetical protein PSACC_02345 [Paramicrosporidium saccamoebae]
MRIPGSVQKLAAELLVERNGEQLAQLMGVLRGDATWRGPFAWSLLLEMKSLDMDTILAELIWCACETVHGVESNLTLKSHDFDRLLCVLTGRLIETRQYTWACCLCSLLHSRLAVAWSDSLNEEFGKLALGREFLNVVPKLAPLEGFVSLSISCQLYWLRLVAVRRVCDLDRVEEILLGTDGILAALSKKPSDVEHALELLMYHWRHAVISILSNSSQGERVMATELNSPRMEKLTATGLNPPHVERLMATELKMYKELGRQAHSREEIRLARLKNLTVYLSQGPIDIAQSLWDFDLGSVCNGEQYLGRIESLPKESLLAMIQWPNIQASSRLILQLVYILKSEDASLPWNICPLEEVTMRAYEVCLRFLALKSSDAAIINDVVSGARRYLKLSVHFNSQESALGVLLSVAKGFAHNGQPRISIHILDACASVISCSEHESLLAETGSSVLAKITEENLALPRNESLLLKIIKVLPRKTSDPSQCLRMIGEKSGSSQIWLATHLSMLSSKSASRVATDWAQIANAHLLNSNNESNLLGVLFVWRHLAKLDTLDLVESVGRLQFDSTEVCHLVISLLCLLGHSSIASTIVCNSPPRILTETWDTRLDKLKSCGSQVEKSQVEFCKGNLKESYKIASEKFHLLLSEIKTQAIPLSDTWLRYHELFVTVEWLLCLCDAAGVWRLTRFYTKAGLSYAESLNLNHWKNRFIEHQQNLQEKLQTTRPGTHAVANAIAEPLRLSEIARWIDSTTCHLSSQRSKTLNLRIFHEQHGECLEARILSLLNWALRCGSGIQFRRAVCLALQTVEGVDCIARLIHLARRKELCDPFTMAWCSIDEELKKTPCSLEKNEIVLFVDADRNLLYIGRHFHLTVFVRIELCSAFMTAFDRVQCIVEDNKAALFKPGAAPVDDTSKRAWWIARYDLEKRLASIVTDMDCWLSPVVPFLTFPSRTIDLPLNLEKHDSADGLIRSVYSVLQSCDTDPECLRLFLRQFKMSDELVELLLRQPKLADEDSNPFMTPAVESKPVIKLILDRYLHEFPWECCTIFKQSLMVRSFLFPSMGIDQISNISAIVNPSGDLQRTEEQLRPVVDEMALRQVIAGRSPTKEEMRNILTHSDLALYFGHGSGEAYLPIDEISTLPSCAATFLFGCSSGRLKPTGSYNAEGALLAFQTAKSPLLLANLWDVTDRDIDKLTIAFLRGLRLPGRLDIKQYADSLQKARSSCLLRLLNGAAPILYIQEGNS